MRFQIFELGLIPFEQGLQFQESLHSKVGSGSLNAGLILCRHHPVVTLGRLAEKNNLKVSEDSLRGQGIGVFRASRGGDITYHGPGQIMVYPILNLKVFKPDLHWYLRQLEGLVIAALADLGVDAQSKEGLTGVWVGDKKISSVGISVRNWVTFYGAALNVRSSDLDNFSLIRPCGMDIMMTSVENCLLREVGFEEVTQALKRRLRCDKSIFA